MKILRTNRNAGKRERIELTTPDDLITLSDKVVSETAKNEFGDLLTQSDVRAMLVARTEVLTQSAAYKRID